MPYRARPHWIRRFRASFTSPFTASVFHPPRLHDPRSSYLAPFDADTSGTQAGFLITYDGLAVQDVDTNLSNTLLGTSATRRPTLRCGTTIPSSLFDHFFSHNRPDRECILDLAKGHLFHCDDDPLPLVRNVTVVNPSGGLPFWRPRPHL